MKRIKVPSDGIMFDGKIMYSHAEIMQRYRSVFKKYIKHPNHYVEHLWKLQDELIRLGVCIHELDRIEDELKGAYKNGHQEEAA
ncbi:hypothetical protein [Longicatena caecimuris]|uniref:hypothetical protein n=1 Tax=Longicatena caecimuris TaxID=1796635 RepID=UPI0018AA26F1|nr:hypothetical protein [Longicatena caecimuris]